MLVATWAQAAGTVLLGLVGLRLAHNYRRQLRLRLAERQVDAYTRPWLVLAPATPFRTEPLDAGGSAAAAAASFGSPRPRGS